MKASYIPCPKCRTRWKLPLTIPERCPLCGRPCGGVVYAAIATWQEEPSEYELVHIAENVGTPLARA